MHKKFFRSFSLFGVALLGITLLSSALPANNQAEAQAGYSAEWIDRTHIRVREGAPLNRSQIYTDQTLDGTYNFKNLNQPSPCQSEIWIDGSPPTNQGSIIVVVTDRVDGNCQLRAAENRVFSPGDVVLDQTKSNHGRPLWNKKAFSSSETFDASSISISNGQASRINFRFVDEDTIERVDGKKVFTRRSGETFIEGDGQCGDSIMLNGRTTISGQPVRTGTHRERSSNAGNECKIDSSRDAHVGEAREPEEGDAGSGDSTQTDPTCESEGAELSWIICPVIFLGDAIMRKLDQAIISLLSVPNDYINNEGLEAAWSRLRNIAYIILVPIALVMVMGTMLGFDFVSAYTVKRALPRMLLAVVFIAFSFEITKFLVVLTNDVGTGLGGLITSVVADSGEVNLASVFSPGQEDGATGLLAGVGLVGATLAVGSIGIVLSYIFIAVVGLAIGFFLLSLRQMLIIALMILAPVAILAWIFPGNDKLWKLWWGTFSKLLLLFPLVILLISAGKVFAVIASDVDGSFVTTLMKLVAYIGPYFMIPAMFKFAGGIFATVSGMANDRSRGLFDRNKKYRQRQMAQNWERNGQRRILDKRADWVGRLQSGASSKGAFGAFAYRAAARGIGGYNIHAARSEKQAQVAKEINDQINTGRDEDIRGLTAAYAYDYAKKHGYKAAKDAGLMDYEVDSNGNITNRQYKSLAGKMIDEANVVAGRQRWGNDTFAQQAALSYEMRKAQTQEEVDSIRTNYASLASSWGLNDSQAAGAWIGPAFENQNKHLEFKYTDWKTGKLKGEDFAKEVYESRGSYAMSQMNASTITALTTAYDDAAQTIATGLVYDPVNQVTRAAKSEEITAAQTTINNVRGAAESFMSRYGGGSQVANVGEDGTPILTQPQAGGQTGAGGEVYRTMSQGAGHVGEAVRDMAVHVGVYRPLDISTETHSAGGDGTQPRQS